MELAALQRTHKAAESVGWDERILGQCDRRDAHHRRAVQVTREVFEASGGRLKVVGRAGVGVDNVDLTAATEVGAASPLKGARIRSSPPLL